MSTDLVLRVLALCLALAGTETLHGIARTVLLVPRIGKERALKLSIVSGSALAFIVCWLLVPGVGLRTNGGHLLLGLVLALFMASFDLLLGKLVLRRTWRRAFDDLNPATGNLLIVGLVLLMVFPLLVRGLRGAA